MKKIIGLVPAKASELAEGASPKKVTLSRFSHRLKAPLPIDLTLSGIVISSRLGQSKNAPFEMDVMPEEN